MHVLITNSESIKKAFLEQSKYEDLGNNIYRSEKSKLLFRNELSKNETKDILQLVRSEIENESSIWFLVEGYSTSNEHQAGDIVLPNVFMEYDTCIDTVEFNKENQDIYMHDPIFLSHYKQQSDVDFELFWLSIGGIQVSKKTDVEWIHKEAVEFAYSADSVDSSLYGILDACKSEWILEITYPLVLILETTTEKEQIARYSQHVPAVVSYFEEDDTDMNDENEDGDEKEMDEFDAYNQDENDTLSR